MNATATDGGFSHAGRSVTTDEWPSGKAPDPGSGARAHKAQICSLNRDADICGIRALNSCRALDQRIRGRLALEPALEGLLEALDLALGLEGVEK